jgi:hypothetical protein
MSKTMLRRSVLVGVFVVAAVALPVAVALATAPVTGALYEGANVARGIDGGSGIGLTFQVSANGKQLTFVAGGYPGPTCSAQGPPPTGQHAAIKDGRFTVKIGTGWSYSGSFLSRGRARGTWKYTQDCQYPVQVVNHYHGTWSANSEPDGAASRYCSEYDSRKGGFYASGIVEEHTSCETVDQALAAGSFATGAPHPFTTPQWKCMGTDSSSRVSCSKGTSKASFRFYEG